MSKVTQNGLSAKEKAKLWVIRNPGIMARIANTCKVVPSMVTMVLHGDRSTSDRQVERLLGRMGAPGFDRKGNRI